MSNFNVVNGAPVNGAAANEILFTLDLELPSLTGKLRMLQEGNIILADLPSLQGSLLGGAIVEGDLPSLTAAIAGSVEDVFRLTGTLPSLGATITVSAEQYLQINANLPSLEGGILSGSRINGVLPSLTGDLVMTAETMMSIAATLPALDATVSGDRYTSMSIDAELPSLATPQAMEIIAALPALKAVIEASLTQTVSTLAYAVNLSNGGMTAYDNYPFQHIIRWQGKSYGFDATGGYLLEGDDDNGTDIEAMAELPESDYGMSNLKNVPYVYISAANAKKFKVTTVVDQDKSVRNNTIMVGRNKRVKFPRGLSGVFWSHKIENICGGDMDIDAVEILPEVKRRKV